jgi:ribosome recycling factor
VKVVRKMAEECKVKQRNVRRDANEKLKALKKDNQISEDELYGFQEEVQKLTDRYILKADEILTVKEKEIMEI